MKAFKSHGLLYLLLSVYIFCICQPVWSSPLCFNIIFKPFSSEVNYNTTNFKNIEILVPIGIKPLSFKDFLENTFANRSIEAVIFWGSRTHYSQGYLPKKSSDLDYEYFFSDKSGLNERDTQGQREYALELGNINRIKVNDSLARWEHGSFEGLIRQEYAFANPPTIAAEQAMLDNIPRFTPRWLKKVLTRNAYKDEYSGGGVYINRDAIVILRESSENQEIKQVLFERGYKNVFIISD